MNRIAEVEVLVIGGGIHGCAVAQAAAAAGYSCLVLEQYPELAQGTSSRSSKLIHGGLRYLETGQLPLVRECLRERAVLLRIAPHLVRLVPFHIPVYPDTHRSPLQLRLGLGLYRMLGGGSFQRLPASEWAALDGLRQEGLRTVLRYQDAQTDDAALTRAVMASAQRLGAQLETGAELRAAVADADGYRVEYRRDGQLHGIRAATVINATGPWVNRTLERFQPAPPQLAMELVAGTHILVPRQLHKGMYYLEAPQDGRAVFVMPWREKIMIGTTERPYEGDPAAIAPSEEEIRYLLEVYNHYFGRPLTRPDVHSAFAGLRVLPGSDERAFARPRDTRLHTDHPKHPRLVSLYGGKLTAYRTTARRVLDLIRPQLPTRAARADTASLPLT
jgi:glycerol-3-phosphate dehydrogenase